MKVCQENGFSAFIVAQSFLLFYFCDNTAICQKILEVEIFTRILYVREI